MQRFQRGLQAFVVVVLLLTVHAVQWLAGGYTHMLDVWTNLLTVYTQDQWSHERDKQHRKTTTNAGEQKKHCTPHWICVQKYQAPSFDEHHTPVQLFCGWLLSRLQFRFFCSLSVSEYSESMKNCNDRFDLFGTASNARSALHGSFAKFRAIAVHNRAIG